MSIRTQSARALSVPERSPPCERKTCYYEQLGTYCPPYATLQHSVLALKVVVLK